MKVCVKIWGSSVAIPQNRLSKSVELSFGSLWNCLSGARGFVLWEPSERSLEDCRLSSPQNHLWNSLNRCAVSFEHSAVTLQWSILQVQKFRRYPAMLLHIICDDSANCRVEIRTKPAQHHILFFSSS